MTDDRIKPSWASMVGAWVQSEEWCLFLSKTGLVWTRQACILWIINSGLGDNGIRRGQPVPEGGRFPHRLQGGSLTVPALLA